MRQILTAGQRRLGVAFAVLSAIYFVISYSFFGLRPGGGDELNFIADMQFVLDHGFVEAIRHQTSVPYMLLAYPLALFLPVLTALRVVNILLVVFLFAYFRWLAKITDNSFYAYLLFYLATVNFFFAGINDPLFIIGMTIFFSETFFFLEEGRMKNTSLAFCALIIAFFTRELVMVYMPAVLVSMFMLYKKGFRWTPKLWLPVIILVVMIIINIPLLSTNHKLSYDNKLPAQGVTWTQRQYLAQLWVNEGKIPNFSHPSWEETRKYIDKNGPDSLPDGILNGLTHDPVLTVMEFFKDLYYSFVFGFRQLALIMIFPFFFIGREIMRKTISFSTFIPLIFAATICIFSLIIISFIEARWYGAVFIPAILFFTVYSRREKLGGELISINYMIMSALALYGIYGIAVRF